MNIESLDKKNIPASWIEWALSERKGWSIDHVKSCYKLFYAYHTEKKTDKENLLQWEFSWHGWVKRQRTESLNIKVKDKWWKTATGIEKKANELGIKKKDDEIFPYFKVRVFYAAGRGPWDVMQ